MRLLLDENISRGLYLVLRLLQQHEVVHAHTTGWAGVTNGELIAKAEAAGFDVMLTADQNIRYQQNLVRRQIGLIVVSTPMWPMQREHLATIEAAIEKAERGCFIDVVLPRPRLIRRPPPMRPS